MVRELPRGREVQFDQGVKRLPESAIRPIEATERVSDYSDVLAEFGGDPRMPVSIRGGERRAYLERPRSVEATERTFMRFLEASYQTSRIELTPATQRKLEQAVLQKSQLEALRTLSDYELERYADELVAVWGQKQKIWERAERSEGRLAAK